MLYRLRYRGTKFWDFIGSTEEVPRHCNIKPMPTPMGCIKYMLKEEGSRACTPGFSPEDYLSAKNAKKSTTATIVANLIREGKRKREDLVEIAELYPSFAFHHLKKMKEFQAFYNQVDETNVETISLEDHPAPYGLNDCEAQIYEWLQYYSRVKTLDKGVYEDQHLRVQGPTKIGKTSLYELLPSFFRVYHVPFDAQWHDLFQVNGHDLIIFDEYGKSRVLTPQDLNGLVDGKGKMLRRRGLPPQMHKEQLPAIMFTNFSWEGCYPNVHKSAPVYLDASKRRFKDVVFPESFLESGEPEFTLFKLCDFLKSIIAGEVEEPTDQESVEDGSLEDDIANLLPLNRPCGGYGISNASSYVPVE